VSIIQNLKTKSFAVLLTSSTQKELSAPKNNQPFYNRSYDKMSDFNYGGTEEESAEIKKLNAEVVSPLSIHVR